MIFFRISKNKILIVGIIILILIIIFSISKNIWFPKVCCIFPAYKLAGTPINKSYPDNKYLAFEEWKQYQDPEVVFFLASETQKFIDSKISELKGYGGISYKWLDESINIDKSYQGKDCQPVRYYYDIILRGTLSGKDLPSFPFGRWYYRDEYKISAVYQPRNQRWEEFKVELKENRLIPRKDLEESLNVINKDSQYQVILKDGYQISEVYWTPAGQSKNSKNETITFIYYKAEKDNSILKNYFIIEVDNAVKNIVFEEKQ